MSATRANPKIVARTDLPQSHMRSNSLETVGDVLAVAYQTKEQGQQPAGFELFDISTPENPRSITFFDCSGPDSRGVHQLWFADGEYIHMSSSAPDFKPTHPKDDQFYRIIDVKNLASRSRSGAGGCRARAKATARRRRCAIPRVPTPGFARTTPTSIPSARTAPISATSTAGS